ncbi:MAG: OmpA family protein [Gammaproteobacteria bacterium]|nr:OmpA family protein [Gammaproteobacteria bacterium]
MSKKRVVVLGTTLLLSGLSSVSSAAPGDKKLTPWKQGLTFTSVTVAGAVLGGPLGLVAGAFGGAYLGEQIERAEEVEEMGGALVQANSQVESLTRELVDGRQKSAQLREIALDILSSQVRFERGSDLLSERDLARVEGLARVLIAYPGMRVQLDGYADPRGTDEYNNVLAHYRAEAVRQALLDAGVSSANIELYSHGADQSRAPQGDLQAYAAERRVEIKVTHPRGNAMVMN